MRNLYNAMTESINDFENNCEGDAARGINKPKFIRLKQPAKQEPHVQVHSKSKMLLYPNPATSVVNVVFEGMKQAIVIDITGRIVLNKQFTGGTNLQLNVGNFGKGVFLVRVISTEGKIETSKLVVQ